MNYLLLSVSLFATYVACKLFDLFFTYCLVKISLKKQKKAIDKEIARIQKYGEQEGFTLWNK
jgi:hypothetical protein